MSIIATEHLTNPQCFVMITSVTVLIQGVVMRPFSEKKKSSSCSVLQTAAATSSSIDGEMQVYSNSKVHPALRGSASTNTLNQPAGRHGNPHR